MKREWKAGDVAKAGNYTIFCLTPENGGRPRWIFDDGSGDVVSAGHLAHARPLVVIDAEDREQVERLARTYCERAYQGRFVLADIAIMQAALREYADPKPPKCTAALSIKGEHFACDLDADHDGLAHSNRDAEVVWSGVQ